jgi:hypothetical protein
VSCILVSVFGATGCNKNGTSGDTNGGGNRNGSGNGNGNGMGQPNGLVISPANPVLKLTAGQPTQTMQFTAARNGQSVSVRWNVDRGEIGKINGAGQFVTTSDIGGVARVSATDGNNSQASTTVTVQVQATDNGDPAYSANLPPPGAGGYGGVGGDGPGGPVDRTRKGTLAGTPTMDASVKLLYPYDGTVWPRGLLAPLLQWNSGNHQFDGAYVHVQESNYEYSGYFAANNKGAFTNLPLPQNAWRQLTYSNGGEPITISVILSEGNQIYGPYSEQWKIASATLKGTIYYNSYGTYLVKNSGTDGLDVNKQQYGAATLAIKAGMTAPVIAAGVDTPAPGGDGSGCRVCHTVSANGKALVTQASTRDAMDYSRTQYLDLTNDTTSGSGTTLPVRSLVYPALYPDGTLLFSATGGFPFRATPPSQLYQLPAGGPVASTGLPDDFEAALPVFSPDGTQLAFNFAQGTFLGGPAPDGLSLAILDFNLNQKAFSNLRILYTPPMDKPVTFSSFLPNGRGIVFQIELSNPSGTWGGTWKGDTAELWWYDLRNNQAHPLTQLNGVGLPDNSAHPVGLDATLNYEPTVNPIASGGYAWVVFTSRRMYGNVAAEDPWMSDPRHYDATTHITDKKLWVAAVDLNAGEIGSIVDPSHPAFYLPAQELRAGNSRGYWTVDPCHADGTSCVTGDECCGGYCSPGNDGVLVCSSAKPSCAAEFDRCDSDGDCCPSTTTTPISCVNHVCTQSAPIS